MYGVAPDHVQEGASQTEGGEDPPSATLARPCLGSGPVGGVGGSGALPVLRHADERPGVGAVPFSRALALVAVASATQPENQGDLGAHEVRDRSLDSFGPYLSPVSSEKTWRYHLRQEPNVLAALAGTRGGVYSNGYSYSDCIPLL